MKKNYTPIKVLLTLICLFAFTALKAQTVTGADGVACKGATVTVTAQTDPNAVKYIWKRYLGIGTTDLNPVTLAGTASVLTDNTLPNIPGKFYTYVSIAVNAGDCPSAPSDPKTVYILPGITSDITSTYNNNTLCVTTTNTGMLTAVPGKADNVTETFLTSDYSYQWYKDGQLITGATDINYTLSTADVASTGAFGYSVTINYKNHPCDPVTSLAKTLTVVALAGQPVISIN